MTRNSEGESVKQCEATYKLEQNHVHCFKDSGHDGGHADVRGNWNSVTESVIENTDSASEIHPK